MGQGFEIELVRDGDAAFVSVSGEVDVATAHELGAQVARAEATDAELIVIDLSRVTFMDSTGLRALLEADARSRENGARLRVTQPSAQVRRLFELTGAETRLPFLADE